MLYGERVGKERIRNMTKAGVLSGVGDAVAVTVAVLDPSQTIEASLMI
jgi:hypothetical protein